MSAESYDVAVVGGGVAGMVAACWLAAAGRRVILLEARGQLGGRASSFRDRHSGDIVDNGQHILMGCYRETLAWLELIGSGAHISSSRTLRVPMVDAHGVRSVLSCPGLPAPWHLAGGILRWSALSWRDRVAVLRVASTLLALRRTTTFSDAWALAPPGETVAMWLTRHGQTARLVRLLWEPLTIAALNQSIERASAGAFLAVLRGVAAGTAADARIVLPKLPLAEVFGAAATRFLVGRGATIALHSPSRVAEGQGQPREIEVRVRDRVHRARAAVVAVPWFHLNAVIGGMSHRLDQLRQQASLLGWSPIVSVNVWYDRSVLDEPFLGLPGPTFQWAFSHPSASAGQRVALVVSDAGAAMRLSDQELVATAATELRAALPVARLAVVRHGQVVRERRATFDVGPHAALRPATTTMVAGVFLAGDWIHTGLPSTIESAAVSGRLAAEAVLAS